MTSLPEGINSLAQPIPVSSSGLTAAWALTWPPERFFWAMLELPRLPRALATRNEPSIQPLLDELIADDVPLPIDELHIVYAYPTQAGNRLLACAARISDLQGLCVDVLELKPSHMPEWVAQSLNSPDTDAPADLSSASQDTQQGQAVKTGAFEVPNLLIGPCTPRPIARQRRRRSLFLALSALSLGMVLSFGLNRRATLFQEQAATLTNATSALVREHVPTLPPAWPATTAELESEHARLKLSRTQPMEPPRDAAELLAALLEGWPRPTFAQTQLLSIADDRITISLSASSIEDARSFARAIKSPSGWVMAQPQWTSTSAASLLTLSASPEPTKAEPSGGVP